MCLKHVVSSLTFPSAYTAKKEKGSTAEITRISYLPWKGNYESDKYSRERIGGVDIIYFV